MPRRPEVPPDAVPFFGRLLSFDCECPNCGTVLSARTGGPETANRARSLRRRHDHSWNAITGRLRCPACRRVFATGLLVYEVEDAGGSAAARAPSDHVPTLAQRLALKALRQARLLGRRVKGRDPTNLAVTRPCCCPEGGWSTACPVHTYVIETLTRLGEPDPPEE